MLKSMLKLMLKLMMTPRVTKMTLRGEDAGANHRTLVAVMEEAEYERAGSAAVAWAGRLQKRSSAHPSRAVRMRKKPGNEVSHHPQTPATERGIDIVIKLIATSLDFRNRTQLKLLTTSIEKKYFFLTRHRPRSLY